MTNCTCAIEILTNEKVILVQTEPGRYSKSDLSRVQLMIEYFFILYSKFAKLVVVLLLKIYLSPWLSRIICMTTRGHLRVEPMIFTLSKISCQKKPSSIPGVRHIGPFQFGGCEVRKLEKVEHV